MCRSTDRSTVTDSDGTVAPSTEPGAPATRSDRTLWGLVGGASLISTALAAYEIAPASVTPLMRESMGIDATAAGLVVSVMFGVAVVASLPTGAILDRTDSRVTMALAVFVLVAAGAWGWWAGEAGQYGSLLASRVVAGGAFVVVWNAGIDIISRAADDARRATMVGVFTASGPLGFAFGQGLSPALAARWGWPVIFVAFNGIALVGLALFWPTSRGLGATSGSAPGFGEFRGVLRQRRVWIVGALGFLGYSLYLFVNSWGPSYLTDEVGLSLGLSGLLVALFPAVGVVSRIGGGVLSDRLFDGRRRPVVLASFVMATPLLATFTRLPSIAFLAGSLLFAGFAIQLMIGLAYAYIRELVEPRVAATAVAFLTAVGLGGGFVSPIAGGAIIDAAGYHAAFLGAGVLSAAGIVLAWRAPEPG